MKTFDKKCEVCGNECNIADMYKGGRLCEGCYDDMREESGSVDFI